MFIFYITMVTTILTCQLIYPKNVIYKAVYLLPTKSHLNNKYKFKKIPIRSINAKNKEIFGSKFTLPWQPNAKWSATILKQQGKRLLFFPLKVFMSTAFKVKITDNVFHVWKIKTNVQYYKFMLLWQQIHQTVLNFFKPSFSKLIFY